MTVAIATLVVTAVIYAATVIDETGIKTDNLIIDDKIGIGITTPTSKLHVVGERGYGSIILVDVDSGGMSGIQVNSISSDAAPALMLTRQGLDKASLYVSPTDNSLNFRISGTDKIKITSDGKVAIGQHTVSNPLDPKTQLEVDGIIKTKPRASAICNTDSEGGVYYDSDDKHFYGCNGTSWVQLDN